MQKEWIAELAAANWMAMQNNEFRKAFEFAEAIYLLTSKPEKSIDANADGFRRLVAKAKAYIHS